MKKIAPEELGQKNLRTPRCALRATRIGLTRRVRRACTYVREIAVRTSIFDNFVWRAKRDVLVSE